MPAPLRTTTVDDPVEELLVTVIWPVAAPVAVGSNTILSVAVWLGFKVNGKVNPEMEKPVPLTVAELMVNAAVPVDDRISVCVAGVLMTTSPKPTLAALTLSVGTPAPSCSVNVLVMLPALAVKVTAMEELTGDTVAVNPAVVDPAGTVTEAGTVTALLLLARPTAKPPVGAAAFSVTVQLFVPAPVIDPIVQVNALSTGTTALNCNAKV
jgi:hypothetical protein